MARKKLLPQHRIFCREYIIDFNGTQAAIRAGYKPSGASRQATEILKRPEAQAFLRELIMAREARTKITGDMVVEELARIGFADIGDFASWGPEGVVLKPTSGMKPGSTRVVSEVSQGEHGPRIRMIDKLGALDKLARHLGMYADNGEDEKEAVPLTINFVTKEAVSEIKVTEGPELKVEDEDEPDETE